MGGLSEFLATVPELAWAALVLGTAVPVISAIVPHGRFRYHHWRLRRRLLAQPIILATELRGFEQTAGDEPDAIDWPQLLGSATLSGSVPAALIWLQENGFDRWVTVGTGLLLLAALVLMLWRRVNDPPEESLTYDDPAYRQSYEVPPEALQGFALAALTLFVLAMIIFTLRA